MTNGLRAVAGASLTAVLLLSAVGTGAAHGHQWEDGVREDPQPPGPRPVQEGHLHWWIRAATHPETGENCWELYAWREPDPPPENRTYQYASDMLDVWDVSGIAYEACPARVNVEAQALELWVRLGPGSTDITVDPGYALTGLPAYVVLGGETERSATETDGDTGITIRIEARAVSYTIDFGDGNDPITTDSRGVAYPGGEGEIKHTYTHKGQPTITVTAQWHARFVAPGIERALPARTAVDTHDLDVREYRAVRVAPGD